MRTLKGSHACICAPASAPPSSSAPRSSRAARRQYDRTGVNAGTCVRRRCRPPCRRATPVPTATPVPPPAPLRPRRRCRRSRRRRPRESGAIAMTKAGQTGTVTVTENGYAGHADGVQRKPVVRRHRYGSPASSTGPSATFTVTAVAAGICQIKVAGHQQSDGCGERHRHHDQRSDHQANAASSGNRCDRKARRDAVAAGLFVCARQRRERVPQSIRSLRSGGFDTMAAASGGRKKAGARTTAKKQRRKRPARKKAGAKKSGAKKGGAKKATRAGLRR